MFRLGTKSAFLRGSIRKVGRLQQPSRLQFLSTEVKPAKKQRKHPFWHGIGVTIKLGFYSFVIYTAGATIALNNDDVEDYWVQYVPGGKSYMDGLYDVWINRSELGERASDGVIGLGYKLGLDKYTKLPPKKDIGSWPVANPPIADMDAKPESSEAHFDELPTRIGSSAEAKSSEAKQAYAKASAEARKAISEAQVRYESKRQELLKVLKDKQEELQRLIGSAKNSGKSPTYKLSEINLKTDDKDVNNLIKTINSLIKALGKKSTPVDIQKEVDHISDSVSALSSKYSDTKKDMSKAAQDSISQIKENLEKKYKDEVAKHSEDLTKELTKTLEESRKEMEQKYNERLKLDVSEAAKAIIEEADNVIARVKVNSAQYLKEVVAKRVESERNGKLANLNALGERVKQIEKQELELSSAAETMIGFRKINSSLDAIRNILYSNTPSEKCGQELVKQINALKNLTKPLKNDVINSALSSLPSDRTLLKTGGVLTQSQLISRWESLTPEIRKVSLAPPNSGVLGQISSFLFSKLLVQKSGVPEKSDDSIAGSDVESVLARVNDDLVKNNLDSAVEEVANMKGWPRRLANDWLEESRKKLELQFLVEVIDTEIRVIS